MQFSRYKENFVISCIFLLLTQWSILQWKRFYLQYSISNMLERVVARMFRRATVINRSEHCCSSANMDASTSATDTVGDNSQLNQAVDVEIDNSSLVAAKIATLYTDRLMSDVCLLVGGQEHPAHRLILCASSEVFQVMLMNPRWDESHQSIVVLQEPHACCQVFGQFLRYLYTGQIRINHITIMPVLMLADKYNVKDLVILCVEYMCSHVAHAALHNQLITWLQYTLSLGHYQVAQACENFVKWNFELVCSSSDFVNFEVEILERLLQQNDLVVHDEMSVYNGVVCWLEGQRKMLQQRSNVDVEVEMAVLVQRTMAHVRFPMMSPRQLAELLLSPLTMLLKEFFIKRMAIGMSYHSDQKEQVEEACQWEGGLGRLQFTPRLYTADKWSSLLTVENYTNLQSYLVHTLMFSSHATLAEHAGEKTCDWVIDLYPKGVWFRKSYLIVWQGTVEVPESVLRTVRVTVTCKDPPVDGIKVKVGLLTRGEQDGLEHVMAVTQCTHRFVDGDNVLNLDDILSFDDLNSPCHSGKLKPSPFLVGSNRDVLKINFVIAPLSEISISDCNTVPIKMWMR